MLEYHQDFQTAESYQAYHLVLIQTQYHSISALLAGYISFPHCLKSDNHFPVEAIQESSQNRPMSNPIKI